MAVCQYGIMPLTPTALPVGVPPVIRRAMSTLHAQYGGRAQSESAKELFIAAVMKYTSYLDVE